MKTTIVINGDVSGNHNHIGNTIYNSYENYLKNTEATYSSADRELLKLIFDHVETEEEKKQIIQSLQSIKKGEYTDVEKQFHVNAWGKLISYSKKFANNLTIDVLANKISDFLTKNNAREVWELLKDKFEI